MVERADLRTMRIPLNHGAGGRKIDAGGIPTVWPGCYQ
jgi:hypothetical protein